MIAPLRRAHRRMWLILAAALPLLLTAAVLARVERTPVNPHVRWGAGP